MLSEALVTFDFPTPMISWWFPVFAVFLFACKIRELPSPWAKQRLSFSSAFCCPFMTHLFLNPKAQTHTEGDMGMLKPFQMWLIKCRIHHLQMRESEKSTRHVEAAVDDWRQRPGTEMRPLWHILRVRWAPWDHQQGTWHVHHAQKMSAKGSGWITHVGQLQVVTSASSFDW